MTFKQTGVETRLDETCIDSNPNLGQILSQRNTLIEEGCTTPLNKEYTLQERKTQDEELGVQRIAVLGPARVFIHGETANSDHVRLVENIQKQMNRCFDVLEQVDPAKAQGEPHPRYRLTNGGWAGSDEQSTGVPLISALFGGMINSKRLQKEPVTIMPAGGSYDRVQGIYPHNYYEIPGTWGDDSKYLIGYSSALIVFEPYGFWTGIELNNAMIQEKPIAVITNKLSSNIDYSKGYEEVSVPLKDGQQGVYRKYIDGAKAANWINRCWNLSFFTTFSKKYALPVNLITHLNNQYLDNDQFKFTDWIQGVLSSLKSEQQLPFKIALVKHLGSSLEFLSDDDKNNYHLVLLAIKQSQNALTHASPQLQTNGALQELAQKEDIIRVRAVNEISNALNVLENYKNNRSNNPKDYYYGFFSKILGGCSKTEKINAADHLIECIQNNKPISPEHASAIRQGQLGTLVKELAKNDRFSFLSITKINDRPPNLQ